MGCFTPSFTGASDLYAVFIAYDVLHYIWSRS